ncbi:MAG: 3-oxoacyl-ACP reductase [Candidatus Margulisbacteria bacterium]|nr:3-oxoacyl-ACP reductase [Candidatus Margulisiibacteriota bacterium]
MKFDSISAKIPSLEISNEWINNELEKLNPEVPPKTVKIYQREISSLLKKSGSKTRFWRDKQKGETAFKLIKAAMLEALEKANLKKDEIDLLIYCGVGKGFKEPANAYFYAHAIDMECSCFDIADACMSWVRALEIAYRFLKSGTYKHIMIVNGEFNIYEHLYPFLWKIKNPKQVEYTLPAYTIGEAATATVLSNSDAEWQFKYKSSPSLANLCTIPLEGYKDFCQKDEKINLHGINRFVSFGGELFSEGEKRLLAHVRKTIADINEADIWFPHAASSTSWQKMGNELNIKPERNYVAVYPRYGNLVSASIPVAINMALSENKLKRGQKVVLWPGSAGMSFCIVQFTY